MELNGEIARILLDSENKQILDITFYEKNLRFQCQQCATFCCKLGGPKLTKWDVKRMEQTGHHREEFLDLYRSGSENPHIFLGNLKSKNNGSCIFLKFNSEKGFYKCLIYDFRPALCRLYPFEFCKVDFQALVIRTIPFCKGLNTQGGTLVDERFVAELFKAASEII